MGKEDILDVARVVIGVLIASAIYERYIEIPVKQAAIKAHLGHNPETKIKQYYLQNEFPLDYPYGYNI